MTTTALTTTDPIQLWDEAISRYLETRRGGLEGNTAKTYGGRGTATGCGDTTSVTGDGGTSMDAGVGSGSGRTLSGKKKAPSLLCEGARELSYIASVG